jgi:hypothetical protein
MIHAQKLHKSFPWFQLYIPFRVNQRVPIDFGYSQRTWRSTKTKGNAFTNHTPLQPSDLSLEPFDSYKCWRWWHTVTWSRWWARLLSRHAVVNWLRPRPGRRKSVGIVGNSFHNDLFSHSQKKTWSSLSTFGTKELTQNFPKQWLLHLYFWRNEKMSSDLWAHGKLSEGSSLALSLPNHTYLTLMCIS